MGLVGSARQVSHLQTFYLPVACGTLTFGSAEREAAIRVAGDLSPMRISQEKRGHD
jgi:hypothetical protein